MRGLLFVVLAFTAACRSSLAYQAEADRIIDAALTSSGAYTKLERLTDDVGHRLSGSPSMERAVVWAEQTLRADGHENVRAEKVMVPHWERGIGRGAIVSPPHHLTLLALGGSAATNGVLRGEVVVLQNIEDVEARKAELAGKIVLFNRAMPAYTLANRSGYGETVPIRSQGPALAAKYGAKAALVRSVTAHSLRTAHTGATRFPPEIAAIPAAAVTIEDAELLARLARRGPVEVELELSARTLPDAESANVIGEIVGREKPEEIILLAAHLDSWDVGQGAHDDGAGCTMIMEALTVLRRANLVPRRTIRAVLFTNEENGLAGAKAYAEQHAAELEQHVAGIEADSGGFAPRGFRVERPPIALARMKELAPYFERLGATEMFEAGAGADVSVLAETHATPSRAQKRAAGSSRGFQRSTVSLLGLDVEGSKYFDYHHSEADTFDKVSREEIQKDTAAMALIAWLLAELPFKLGEPEIETAR